MTTPRFLTGAVLLRRDGILSARRARQRSRKYRSAKGRTVSFPDCLLLTMSSSYSLGGSDKKANGGMSFNGSFSSNAKVPSSSARLTSRLGGP